ncbi:MULTISPECIES: ABC transporter permease [unclassified Leeuwenhoekiella]|uniref:ABC transporter permease n=1 Tax=unclassified Leeuwenhoekiella TaxID=2615029 RepID=UPI000C4AE6E4|nr:MULTISPECIES: ABC transporter permease [unclassified Leeuwenhoekiella]MAW96918.1 acetylornithine deacetylase [Leeuwenhoekiella sp.]MBA80622.1 acetylornithine deacetylase [Leeuwenhoekiella sp.]|tara:strand:- start:12118 stop:14475 length:2358 start_codon:yes stop_codon:yes gene_type:complete
MLKNYIKIAFRNLWKNKGFSALNIFGLAIGVTCASLILLWVEDEMSFDTVVADQERVYSVPTNQTYEGQVRTFFQATPGPLAAALKAEIPEITKAARLRNADFLFSVNTSSITSTGAFADDDIFDLFDLKFIEGNAGDAFKLQEGIVITKAVAQILFENPTDLLGKVIRVNQQDNFKITGVVENLPENTTYSFNWLVPFKNFTKDKPWTQEYGSKFTDTFVMLAPGADFNTVNAKVKQILPAKTDDADTQAILHAAKNWHLRSDFKDGQIVGGRIEYVRLFSFIALIILVIACINFMNLSTARSEKRANEVGVRKTLGSDKKQLVFQFITEALMTAVLAAVLSILVLILILPAFNALIDKQLALDIFNPTHFLSLIAITLTCGVFAGLYPAFYLSSFKPIDVLKGNRIQAKGAGFIRKGLVITQFAISIIFIISTLLVYQQVQHVKNRDLGLNKENLIEIPVNGALIENRKAIAESLKNTGMISNLGIANSNILSAGNNGSGLRWQGGDNSEDVLVSFRYTNDEYLKTTGIELIEGRGFSPVVAQDSTHVIITESFAKLMGTGSALGKTIDWYGDVFTVIGVANDYLYGDMYGTSDPVMFFHFPSEAAYMYLKTNPNYTTSEILNTVESTLKIYNPGYPFEYRFVDEAFNARFKNEQLIGNLSRIFALLAILISCLGLLGLSAYTAEQRRKEIGVRKVLGSSVANIVRLLSKDFIVLVLVAIVIAIPLAWYIMYNWLQGFAYRISINAWVFAVAGIAAIGIALLTVSFQAIKAAIANPVKSLRTE